jgi:hypothetical protein
MVDVYVKLWPCRGPPTVGLLRLERVPRRRTAGSELGT